ncbi:MAG: YceD family protein [Betaproteobacteria bacterium]|nr:YceD family protein [Betaproteobacteria bacterium]MDH3436950.1 YceD family protein [Betaproteobacteria bacterium]
MFAQAVIDSLEFARTEQTLHGNLRVSGLLRLQDSLQDAQGQVDVVVQGGKDGQRRPILRLDVTGALHLRCQRCLGRLDYPLRLSNTLLLVSGAEAESEEFDEMEADWIVASAELDVAALIEDEIILSLPYAPRHAEGQCERGGARNLDDGAASQFAKLAVLKKDHH